MPAKGITQARPSVRPSSSAAQAAEGATTAARTSGSAVSGTRISGEGRRPERAYRRIYSGSTPPARGSARRRHHDLDRVLRRGELCLDGRAGRRVAGRDPAVPERVHLVEGGDVGKPDIRRQELRLVGAGLGEQAVDDRQDVLGLLGGAPAGGV